MSRTIAGVALWLLAAPFLLFPDAAPLFTAAGMLLLCGMLFMRRRATGHFFKGTMLDAWILILLGLTTLAFLLSPTPALSLPKLTAVYLGVHGYYLVQEWCDAKAAERQQRQRWLTAFLASAGVFIGGLLLFTVEWPERQLLDMSALTSALPHLSGSFWIHPNEGAGVLLLLLPFAAYFAIAERRARPAGIAATGWMLLIIWLMQSRATFLALVVMLLVVLAWFRLPFRRLLLGAALLLTLAIVLFTISGLQLGQVSEWAVLLDQASKPGSGAPQSLPMRAEIWGAAIEMAKAYPLTGVGLGAFAPVSRLNYAFEAVYPAFEFAHAHNFWLQSVADFGLAGALVVSGMLAIPIVALWSARRAAGGERDSLLVTYGASLISYAAYGILDVISLAQRPGVLVWLVLAGSVALAGVTHSFSKKTHLLALAPLALLLLLTISPSRSRNLANLRLDAARVNRGTTPEIGSPDWDVLDARRRGVTALLQDDEARALVELGRDPQASAYLQSQGRLAHHNQEFHQALRFYDLALLLDDGNVFAYFWRAETYEHLGEDVQALADLEQAVRRSSDQGLSPLWEGYLYFRWGNALAAEEEWRAAARALAQAIALYDESAIYYERLGDVLLELGDEEAATEAYREARRRE